MMSTSSSLSLLTQFEQQYSVQTAEITARIGALKALASGDRPVAIQTVQRMLADVHDLLEQMEMSVRDLDPSSADRSKYDLRVRSYRNDKKQLDAELHKALQRLREGSERIELMSYDDPSVSIDQQDQLIENTQRLERSSRKLQDSYRMVVETEEIGTEVLGNLSSQRETISRARERLREADADLGRSNKLVSQMIRRVIQNRLLLIAIAVLLMFALLFLIYKSL